MHRSLSLSSGFGEGEVKASACGGAEAVHFCVDANERRIRTRVVRPPICPHARLLHPPTVLNPRVVLRSTGRLCGIDESTNPLANLISKYSLLASG